MGTDINMSDCSPFNQVQMNKKGLQKKGDLRVSFSFSLIQTKFVEF